MKGKMVGHASESDYESGSDDFQSDCASDSDSGSGSDPETEPELKTFLFDFKYQLREGAKNTIHAVSPALLKPPWWVLLQMAKEEYGITLNVKFTAPYSPELHAIELMWADGKGYVAHPTNCHSDRHISELPILMRQKFHGSSVSQG